MLPAYRTIYQMGQWEEIINKSRFIGIAVPIKTEEEAIEAIEKSKQTFKGATHYVYAYILGYQQEVQRYSDDGEPNGTAGIPMINYLKSENLTHLVVIVIRYFGGIKLGTGGLARAYSKVAKQSVDQGKIMTAQGFVQVAITFDYALLGKLENRLESMPCHLISKTFEAKPQFILLIKETQVSQVYEHLVELTSDQLDWEEQQRTYYLEENNNIYPIE